MKRNLYIIAILGIAVIGTLSAQETDQSEQRATPEISSTVANTDNPGIGLLDQATEAKLRASTVADLSQVIVFCQRAKKTGLCGDDLEYCNQLLASTQLSRGLFLAQELTKPGVRPGNAQELVRRALIDLEEAVTIIKDQPMPYMQIALLNLLPDGNKDRAKETLKLALQHANNEPEIQIRVVLLLADLEPEAEKRAVVLETAAQSGNPEIIMLHALTLFELKRNEEAQSILKKLALAESGNIARHEQIIMLLAEFKEYESAMSIIEEMKEKNTNGEQHQHRYDLKKAALYAKMKQYEQALKLLGSLNEKFQGDKDLMMETLELRCDVHLAMENLEEALKEIEAAEKTNQNSPSILEQKYDILVGLERYNDALAAAKKMQSISESPHGFLREILVLIELREFDAAIEIVKKMQEKFPDNETGWTIVLVDIYIKQGTYDKAMTLVEEQLKESPDELRWIVAKNKVLSGQKKWDEAVTWLESCLQKEPDSKAIKLLLLETLLISKNYKAVRERIKPLLATDPNNSMLLHLDSQAAISLGLHFDAVKILAKLIEADPEDYTSINNLAWILCTSPIDSIRNARRAVELAEQAGKLTNYKRAFVLSTLAAAYAEAGDFEKAREMSLKSVDVAKKERGKTEEERAELLENLQKEWDCFKKDMPYRELIERGE